MSPIGKKHIWIWSPQSGEFKYTIPTPARPLALPYEPWKDCKLTHQMIFFIFLFFKWMTWKQSANSAYSRGWKECKVILMTLYRVRPTDCFKIIHLMHQLAVFPPLVRESQWSCWGGNGIFELARWWGSHPCASFLLEICFPKTPVFLYSFSMW